MKSKYLKKIFPSGFRVSKRIISGSWASLFLILTFTSLNLQASPTAGELPKVLKEIEQRYAEAGTLVADFEQINESTAFKRKTKSSGNIAVKRPDKVRWQTLSPDPNLLVSNGKTFWFYTPPFDEEEPGQVVIRKSSEVQSQLANALLAGNFTSAKEMKIEEHSPSRFELTPAKGTAATVEKAEIFIDPAKKLITKVILTHRGGNRAEITLSKIKLGSKLKDQIFEFEIPPNTTVIKE